MLGTIGFKVSLKLESKFDYNSWCFHGHPTIIPIFIPKVIYLLTVFWVQHLMMHVKSETVRVSSCLKLSPAYTSPVIELQSTFDL